MKSLSREVSDALLCYRNRKYQEAWDILSKIENPEDAEAYMILGYLFYWGDGPVDKDEEKGISLIKKSAEMGCIEAQWFYADSLVMSNDSEAKEQGYQIMKRLAYNRYIPAIRKMAAYCRVDARHHVMGTGIPIPDFYGTMYWRKELLKEIKECNASIYQHAENLMNDVDYRRLIGDDGYINEINKTLEISSVLGSRSGVGNLAYYYKNKALSPNVKNNPEIVSLEPSEEEAMSFLYNNSNSIKALYWMLKEYEIKNKIDDINNQAKIDCFHFSDGALEGVKEIMKKLLSGVQESI